MTTSTVVYTLGATLVVTGLGVALRTLTWRRANRPLAIEAAPIRRVIEASPNPVMQAYHLDGYAVGTPQAIMVAAHEAGLVNERYDTKAPWDNVREPGYLDACAQVLHLDPDAGTTYEGLDPDDERDADGWIAALERAGYSVTRGQVALDQAYARVINEEFEPCDRAISAAWERVMVAGSDTIIAWANEWKEFAEAHRLEAATVEIRGIQEWIDSELAADAAASIIAEGGVVPDTLAELTDAPH